MGKMIRNLKIGQQVWLYMNTHQNINDFRWWSDATIVSKNDQTEKLVVRYDSGKLQRTLEYYTVPHRIMTAIVEWEQHKELVQAAVKILQCKTEGKSVPQGLWATTNDV